ncbi:MAG: threonylcarbamoyl-AMP synthase [Bacteroidales bacterium]|nr:MAG: threonylcarbamoyl-AMP synthase [Bacteroidales bacterium]
MMEKEVEAALEVLRRGGLILYPTDTVWGIGCDATDEKAVERIYELKRSVNKHSMLVLCRNADMIVRYVNKAPGIAFEVLEMATKPLTLILEGPLAWPRTSSPRRGRWVCACPTTSSASRLLRRFGKPIVSTSANISGEETPKGLDKVSREIIDGVDYVVNPRVQGHPTGKPSSIVAFGPRGEVKIIRK